MTKRFVCIHGHFYQPPRENPWLEEIERQASAYPYHDWNQRINAECYAPNSAARIQDDHGRIRDIVNNYGHISFNFGPTLLSWLNLHAAALYSLILDSDRPNSSRFSGKGPALAQAYNHIILPLANSRDKRTQIFWGVRDFQRRFQRPPEGMWLPETAVDVESLELMADEGLGFTILAPHQAARVRKIGQDSWQDVSGGGIDPRRPYVCRLSQGREIDLFFYHGPLAHSVAFGDSLQSGDLFAEQIRGAFDPDRKEPQLVHLATDGETYGHHHRFGEMALASALRSLENSRDIRLTIYAEYLKDHPPEWEVEIREGTSWSCPHGVERWRSSCGCRSGSHSEWNQDWRFPLRKALDWLRDQLAPIFEKVLSEYRVDPWALRNEYIDLILDRSEYSQAGFFRKVGLSGLSSSQKTRILTSLEMQRAANLMFTSCGWFFDDIGRIESRQILAYASRALQLAAELGQKQLEKEFLLRLHQARSNDPEVRNAAHLYTTKILPARIDLRHVGLQYAASSLVQPYPEEIRIGAYQAVRKKFWGKDRHFGLGRVELQALTTARKTFLDFAVLHSQGVEIEAGIKADPDPIQDSGHFADLRSALEKGETPAFRELLKKHFGPVLYGFPDILRKGKREVLLRLMGGEGLDLDKLRYSSQECLDRGVPSVALPLTLVIGERIESEIRKLDRDPLTLGILKRAQTLLSFVSSRDLEPNLARSQTILFQVFKTHGIQMEARAAGGDSFAQEWMARILALGRDMGFESLGG